MDSRITQILERWFIREPALFQVLCAHEFQPNGNMSCPMRCGYRRIEYNPEAVAQMSDGGLEEALRTEALRILLKHPYERKPEGCCQQAIAIGSNIVIGDSYRYRNFRIDTPADYDLESGMPYEWYSRRIQSMLPPGGGGLACDSDGSGMSGKMQEAADRNRELSELWDEDEVTLSLINGIIEGCTEWGSLAGDMAERLKASTRATINWRTIFNGFRGSILSSKRKLTRMRPNRRSGFDQMGSTRRFDTKLLVAVDVSGSISSESLSWFYGVINSAFRYGFEAIDVIQFDCGVRMVQNLRKVVRETIAVGRGGTSFQEPVNFAHEKGYDGLVILTDGYAPEPEIPENMKCRIMWVCVNQGCYDRHHPWMEKSGRVCTIELK